MTIERRREALRRLRPIQELFGRGDMLQWHRYLRDDAQNDWLFAAWDDGRKDVFSGMEGTTLWSRAEATERLRGLDPRSFEAEALRRVLALTR